MFGGWSATRFGIIVFCIVLAIVLDKKKKK